MHPAILLAAAWLGRERGPGVRPATGSAVAGSGARPARAAGSGSAGYSTVGSADGGGELS
jgi:hypothetical protein